MKLTQKNTGLGFVALAVVLLGTAAFADRQGGPEDRGGAGMMGPAFDFAAIDANKDGKVTPEELTAWRKAQAVGIDTNADGKLSVDELAAMDLKAMTDRAKARATEMVARLDTDGDGMLSASELVSPPVPTDLFARIDTNKDGAVDQAEADAAMQMMQHGHGGHGHGNNNDGGQGQNGDDSNNDSGNGGN